MSNGSELKSRSAQALRAAGFLPLPRLWATREQLDLIVYLLRENEDQVREIRRQANAPARPLTKEEEMDLAWRMRR